MLSRILLIFGVALGVLGLGSVGGYFYAKNKTETNIKLQLDKLVALTSTVGRLQYGKIILKPFKGSVEVLDWKFKPHKSSDELEMGSAKIDNIDVESVIAIIRNEKPMLKSVRWTFSDIHLTEKLLGEKSSPFLKEMGYSEFYVSASLGFSYDSSKERLDINDLWIQGDQVGKIGLQISFGNFPFPTKDEFEKMESTPGYSKMFAQKYLTGTINKFRLDFEDQSLTSRLRYAFYKVNKTDPVQMMNMLMLAAERLPAASFELRSKQAIMDFLQKPSKISFVVEPQQPIAFLRLATMAHESPDKIASEVGAYWEVGGKKY